MNRRTSALFWSIDTRSLRARLSDRPHRPSSGRHAAPLRRAPSARSCRAQPWSTVLVRSAAPRSLLLGPGRPARGGSGPVHRDSARQARVTRVGSAGRRNHHVACRRRCAGLADAGPWSGPSWEEAEAGPGGRTSTGRTGRTSPRRTIGRGPGGSHIGTPGRLAIPSRVVPVAVRSGDGVDRREPARSEQCCRCHRRAACASSCTRRPRSSSSPTRCRTRPSSGSSPTPTTSGSSAGSG